MPTARFSKYFVLISVFLLAACAPKQDKPADFQLAPDGPAGYATLYVFRPFDGIEHSAAPTVYIENQNIFDMKRGSYTVVYLKPGHYQITTKESSLLTIADDNISGEFDISSTAEYYLLFDQVVTPIETNGAALAREIFGGPKPIGGRDYVKWTVVTNRYDKLRIRDCFYVPSRVAALPEVQ